MLAAPKRKKNVKDVNLVNSILDTNYKYLYIKYL